MAAKIPVRFTNEDAARKHLEKLQWPNGPVCPHCSAVNRASSIKGGRPGLWFCNACRKQFSVTVGTIFERSKVPLNTWLYANHLLCSSKKGFSSHQLARMLGVTYKTAWFMAHRIREAMAPDSAEPPIGGAGKTVEADETFIGHAHGKEKKPGYSHKIAVLSLVERGGKLRSFKLEDKPTSVEVLGILREQADTKSRLVTDGGRYYRFPGFAKHQSVDHNKTYVTDGDVHTNTLEGFFSVFKRGMVGTYQHCGEQHLQRYLCEFDFRQNTRAKLGIDDASRADMALKGAKGKRLTYRRTHETQNNSSEG